MGPSMDLQRTPHFIDIYIGGLALNNVKYKFIVIDQNIILICFNNNIVILDGIEGFRQIEKVGNSYSYHLAL